jgi:hypothetical protein
MEPVGKTMGSTTMKRPVSGVTNLLSEKGVTEKDRSHIVQAVSDFDSGCSVGELQHDQVDTRNIALRR